MSEGQDLIDYGEALQGVETYRELTEIQRKVISTYLTEPTLNQVEIADKIGVRRNTVHQVFHSKYFSLIATELAKLEMKQLLRPAMKALRESLNSNSPLVKLSAALKVLSDAGVIKLRESSDKEDTVTTVIWQGGPQGEALSASNRDTVPTDAQAEARPRLPSPV